MIVNGGIEIRSSVDDALWMYRVVELLLDGAARVPRLRRLSGQFRQGAAGRPPEPPLVDWRADATEVELAMLARLGLLVDQRMDHDG